MKRKYIKRITGIALLLLAVGVYVWFMQATVTNMDQSEARDLRSFYMEKPGTHDVVVLGSSEIRTGYSAAEAYRHAGFTSFPYAFSINSVLLWKYELKDIERLQDPEVLIIETNGALYEEDKYLYSEFCLDTLLEGMKMSPNRIRAACEQSDNPVEKVVPFIRYHYKWPKIRGLRENAYFMVMCQGHARLRGAFNYTSDEDISLDDLYPPDGTKGPLNENAGKALAEFLEDCKASHIKHIVFVEYPHIINDEEKYTRQQRANTAAEMIRAAGFDYIDLNAETDKIGLDYSVDFFDADHLYASGQRKMTHYLADIIRDRYLVDVRKQTEENRREWDESAELIEKYYRLSDEYIKEEKGLQLMEDRTTMDALGAM